MSTAPPLALLLVLSLASNVAQWYAYGNQVELRVQAENQKKEFSDAAATCSDSVATLKDAAEKRKAAARPAVDAARADAQAAGVAAQRLLAAPPAVPGDDCASAQASVSTWLRDRSKAGAP